MNFTTLFGFIAPNMYVMVGGWSIGNEMVYYFFTPFILYTYNKNLVYGNILFLISFIIGLFYSFFLLNNYQSIADGWNIYINPFSNLFSLF